MIVIVFTGGTIAMQVDPATGAAVPALSGHEVLARVPGVDRLADVEVDDFGRLPGPHMTPEQMWRLARRVGAWLERPDVDGVVITHGTDTIEETAALLDLALVTDKPVAIVGAIRTSSEPSWDGAGHLLDAIRVVSTASARGRGVLVVMHERIYAAADVRKVHSESTRSFDAPEFGPLGVVDAGQVLFRRDLRRPGAWRAPDADGLLRVRRLETRVDLVKVVAGTDDRWLRWIAASGARGLVLEGLGRGNVPAAAVPGVRAALDAGLVVAMTTRCGEGSVSPRYAYEGALHGLLPLGVVPAGRRSGPAARMALMVMLGYTDDRAEIARLFADE
ncbi:MAG: asparaginase [Acidobacteria bacterium]|nr:asparaginase [Acidobacteriota bacterium]